MHVIYKDGQRTVKQKEVASRLKRFKALSIYSRQQSPSIISGSALSMLENQLVPPSASLNPHEISVTKWPSQVSTQVLASVRIRSPLASGVTGVSQKASVPGLLAIFNSEHPHCTSMEAIS